jgi:hypothetical protein
MPSLILPRRFYSQPHGAVELSPDWLAKGLVLVKSGGDFSRLSDSLVATSEGLAGRINTGTGRDLGFSPWAGGNSFYIDFTPNLLTTNYRYIGYGPANYDGAISYRHINGTPSFAPAVFNQPSGTNTASWPTVITTSTRQALAAYKASGTAQTVYGSQNGDPMQSIGYLTNNVTTPFSLRDLASLGTDYSVRLVLGFSNYRLTDGDVKQLWDNPWQIFRAKPRILYFDVATGGAQTLTPSLVTNSQTFHAATVTRGGVSLTPSLVTNSQTFHAASISVGAVTLTPSLVTNSQTFHAATVTQAGGTQYLTPSVVTNTQTFPSATVAPGSVDILPTLLTNSQSFYAPVVSQAGLTLVPSLVTNSQTFFSATVSTGAVSVLPTLVTNDQIFFGPTVSTAGTGTLDAATIAAIADAVWVHATAVDFGTRMTICSRILRNKTVTDPVTGVMTVYADDGVTPYLTAQLHEDALETQTYRGQGAEVRARLQ